MSQVYCWECGESFAKDQVLDIPVFKKDTVIWCLNCVMKQLNLTDYRLILKPENYKKFKVKSCEDDAKEYLNILDELIFCYELQFRKLKEIDYTWGELQQLASEIQYGEEDETVC